MYLTKKCNCYIFGCENLIFKEMNTTAILLPSSDKTSPLSNTAVTYQMTALSNAG